MNQLQQLLKRQRQEPLTLLDIQERNTLLTKILHESGHVDELDRTDLTSCSRECVATWGQVKRRRIPGGDLKDDKASLISPLEPTLPFTVTSFDEDGSADTSMAVGEVVSVVLEDDQGDTGNQSNQKGKVVHTRKTPDHRVRKYKKIAQEIDGSYVIPARYGSVRLLDLGKVSQEAAFHTERYIFPIGYHIRRPYLSTVKDNEEAMYECRILDAENAPLVG
jgi:hypothetical protein